MAEVNWRPIDTAPRDGTPVLLWGEVFLGIFHWGDPGSVLSGRPHPPGWVGCTVIPPGLDNTDMLGPITLAGAGDATHWALTPFGPDPEGL